MRVGSRTFLLFATVAALALPAAVAQAQVTFSDVAKNLEYLQTGDTTVNPLGGGTNAFFYARTFFPAASDYDGFNLTFAGPASPQTGNISGLLGSYYLGYQTGYMTKAALDANFPTGISYNLSVTDSTLVNPTTTVVVPYAADIFTSAIPTVSNFTALQSLNPALATTIDFNSFTPNAGATLGQDFFTIYDLTAGGAPFNVAGFSNSATSLTVAGGTLIAGHDYEYELIFDDLLAGTDPVSGVPYNTRSDQRTLGFFDVPSSAIPEPATWAMMMVGIGLAGAALRRRGAIAVL